MGKECNENNKFTNGARERGLGVLTFFKISIKILEVFRSNGIIQLAGSGTGCDRKL